MQWPAPRGTQIFPSSRSLFRHCFRVRVRVRVRDRDRVPVFVCRVLWCRVLWCRVICSYAIIRPNLTGVGAWRILPIPAYRFLRSVVWGVPYFTKSETADLGAWPLPQEPELGGCHPATRWNAAVCKPHYSKFFHKLRRLKWWVQHLQEHESSHMLTSTNARHSRSHLGWSVLPPEPTLWEMRSGDRRLGRPYSSPLFHLITALGLEQLGTSDKHSEHHQILLHPHVLIYSRIDGIRLIPKAPGPIPAAWPRAVTYRETQGRGWRDLCGGMYRSSLPAYHNVLAGGSVYGLFI